MAWTSQVRAGTGVGSLSGGAGGVLGNSMSEQNAPYTEPLSVKLLAGVAALASDAENAANAAGEILDLCPGQPQALLLLVNALKLVEAEEVACELLAIMAQDFRGLAS